ncbi:hypothetical protein TNCV_462871 [Trichonephila clavipes]|nr:hypothetical protein TNCV_462871 [Trichonephila clavipes]
MTTGHITPESKRQSMEWRHINSPPVRVKAKRTISTRKVMETVFWDRHGVLLVEFMQQGQHKCSRLLRYPNLT